LAKIIILPTHNDERGSLTVIERILPFDIKRLYYISNVPTDSIRGGHRHKTNMQALISVAGSCKIYSNNGRIEKEFSLNSPDKCLILKPEDWHTMHSFSKDCVLLVLASEYYDINEYIDEPYK
jgi:hypothetical protein